jgi:pimeloyl-ACP methyl ester carboxylesterase
MDGGTPDHGRPDRERPRAGDPDRGRVAGPRAIATRHGPVVSHVAGEGPPLVLLHGLAASWAWWRRNIPALSAAFRVTAIDLPGFGGTHRDARFVLEDVPRQVVDLMADIGIDRAHVVGHSMGGVVAGGIAAEHPERVDKLVLVDAGFIALEPSWRHRITGAVATLPWSSASMAPVLVRDLWRSGLVRMAGATVEVLGNDWQGKLPSVQAPTLVVWGEHDGICAPTIGRQVAAMIPGATLTVIAGAGHNPMWERAEAFDREVLAFLGSGIAGA